MRLPAEDSGMLKRETKEYQRGGKDLLAPKETSSWRVWDQVFTTVSPAPTTALSEELALNKLMQMSERMLGWKCQGAQVNQEKAFLFLYSFICLSLSFLFF